MTYSQINPTKVGGFLLLISLILVSGCSSNQQQKEQSELQNKIKCASKIWNDDGSFKLVSCKEYDEIESNWIKKGCHYQFSDCEELEKEYNETGGITIEFLNWTFYCDDLRDGFDLPFIPDCNITKEVSAD